MFVPRTLYIVCAGGKQRMAQHFHGYLAGLSVVNNKTEDDDVISCLNECQEKLDLTTVDTADDTVRNTHRRRCVTVTCHVRRSADTCSQLGSESLWLATITAVRFQWFICLQTQW